MKTVVFGVLVALISQGAYAATKVNCNERMINAAANLYHGNNGVIQGSAPDWQDPKFVRAIAEGHEFRVDGADGNDDGDTWQMSYSVKILPGACQIFSVRDLEFKHHQKPVRPTTRTLENCKKEMTEMVSEIALLNYGRGVRVDKADVAFDARRPGTATVYLDLCSKGGCGGNSYGVKFAFDKYSCFVGSIELTSEE